MRWFLFLLPAALLAESPVSVGIKLGAPLTDAFKIATSGSYSADQRNVIVGPTVELKLPFGFGIEVDALYRKYNYRYTNASTAVGDLISATREANSWQFPVLAKVRGGLPLIKPYAVAGLSFQHLTGLKQTLSCVGGNCNRSFNDISHDSNIGLTLGGGLQIKALVLKISPEIRYTRWGFANFDTGLSRLLKSNQNQADVLVGITF